MAQRSKRLSRQGYPDDTFESRTCVIGVRTSEEGSTKRSRRKIDSALVVLAAILFHRSDMNHRASVTAGLRSYFGESFGGEPIL